MVFRLTAGVLGTVIPAVLQQAGIFAGLLHGHAVVDGHRTVVDNRIIGVVIGRIRRRPRILAAVKCAAVEVRNALIPQRCLTMIDVVHLTGAHHLQGALIGDGMLRVLIGQREGSQVQRDGRVLRDRDILLRIRQQDHRFPVGRVNRRLHRLVAGAVDLSDIAFRRKSGHRQHRCTCHGERQGNRRPLFQAFSHT